MLLVGETVYQLTSICTSNKWRSILSFRKRIYSRKTLGACWVDTTEGSGLLGRHTTEGSDLLGRHTTEGSDLLDRHTTEGSDLQGRHDRG